MIRRRLSVPIILLLLTTASCGPRVELSEESVSRREYLLALGEAGLLEGEVAARWRSLGEEALTAGAVVEIPFRRSWSANPEYEARSFRFDTDRREQLIVGATIEGEGVIFLSLYELRGNQRRFLFSTNQRETRFRASRNGSYLLLAQPEIYAEGEAVVSVEKADSSNSEEAAAIMLSPGMSRRP